jgi:hypothetical protein
LGMQMFLSWAASTSPLAAPAGRVQRLVRKVAQQVAELHPTMTSLSGSSDC